MKEQLNGGKLSHTFLSWRNAEKIEKSALDLA